MPSAPFLRPGLSNLADGGMLSGHGSQHLRLALEGAYAFATAAMPAAHLAQAALLSAKKVSQIDLPGLKHTGCSPQRQAQVVHGYPRPGHQDRRQQVQVRQV